ncbi:carbohydrate ABC transporter permease [Paenibacillus beijingensis]|uniref:Sugar ABC transporter permease n=1 Tax=Paenibacillus beijingensis TaxID=1126833 RepID=A0A0D5NGJ1_9BACL|nr:carbohydrate ABC transporter permease [Paenibacillus beijingensis]AJY74087.1 sugar ABC transporter permease [Paenibacillus beijingensis]
MKAGRRALSYKLFIGESVAALTALLFLVPFYFALVNSFKPPSEILSHTAAFPRHFTWDNFVKAWDVLKFPRALYNSLVITVFSNLGLTLITAMAAHRMVRRPNGFNRLMFGLFVASMVIPFQAVMIPLVQVIRATGLINTLAGVIFTYCGLGIAFSTFLFHGFVKSIPYEIEESALIDGCTPLGLFWRIVLPLLKPITVTVILLNTLWFWNDFLLPLLLLHNPEDRTVQLAINSLIGQFMTKWDLALAALVMGIAPAVVFFLFLQRRIIEGITSGSVKG